MHWIGCCLVIMASLTAGKSVVGVCRPRTRGVDRPREPILLPGDAGEVPTHPVPWSELWSKSFGKPGIARRPAPMRVAVTGVAGECSPNFPTNNPADMCCRSLPYLQKVSLAIKWTDTAQTYFLSLFNWDCWYISPEHM